MSLKIEESKVAEDVKSWTISNGNISFSAMNFGCTITNLFVPDKNGRKIDVLLGFDDFDDGSFGKKNTCWKNGTEAHNALVGRFANRIGGASFVLDGKKYSLDKNDGNDGNGNHINCLHGGFFRFEKQIWQGESFENQDAAGVIFTRRSVDGEQHFLGNLEIKVVYSLNQKNRIKLEYFAKTDSATPLNLTNHAYFNLDGSGDILNHKVWIDSEKILEIKNMIPTGKFLDVLKSENKAFDFRKAKKVKDDFDLVKKSDSVAAGYDHCFVTKADEKDAVLTASCESEKSGIKMKLYTNQRGIQLYTGNYLFGLGKNGSEQKPQSGICFEAERFPDSVNHENFPSCILRPGEEYHQVTIYEFN